jgi:hypothetical protein
MFSSNYGSYLLKIDGNLINSVGSSFTLGYDAPFIPFPFSAYNIAGSVVNSGTIELIGALPVQVTLQVNGDVNNSGQITMSGGSVLGIGGTLTNDVGGSFLLNGPSNQASVGGSIVNSGVIDLEGASTLQVNGSISNSRQITTSYYGNGGNTMIVGGRLTNGLTGTFSLEGASDIANIGSVVNQGAMYIANGATLNVTGGPRASGSVFSGFTNTGIVNISQGGTLASPNNYVQTAGQTTVDGSLNISGRGMIYFAGGAVYGD